MNSLKGKIIKIKSDEHFSIVEMEVGGVSLKSIIIEIPESVPFLKIDSLVKILFKETEVSIAKNFSGKISLQNKLPCKIKEIERGKLLSKLILDCKGNKIISIITTAAVEQLELNQNEEVLALIKTNEVILAPL